MTHTIKSNNRTWCFVEVPDGAGEIGVNNSYFRSSGVHPSTVDFQLKHNGVGRYSAIPLPPGQWSIHADSAAMTEALAGEVVTNEGTKARPIYPDYSDPFRSMFLSVASLDTLAASLGITGRYFILLNIND